MDGRECKQIVKNYEQNVNIRMQQQLKQHVYWG